jgi:hypothetical protein
MKEFQTKVVERSQNTFLFNNVFCENRDIYVYVEKYGTARQAAVDNRTHAHFMLDN